MFTPPFYAILAIAIIDWVAVWRGWSKMRLMSKPLTLMLLLIWFTSIGFWQGGLLWFGLALVFSLLGDIFLLWEKFFAPGLGSFLLAQICYVIGFTQDGLIEVRDQNLIPLPERNAARKLVAEENADRVALYREIAVANNHPEWEADIRTTFAALSPASAASMKASHLPAATRRWSR